MRVITLNANGLRSATTKGVFNWLRRQSADFVCLQEIRIQREQLDQRTHFPPRLHCEYVSAERPGYSGVALLARTAPEHIVRGLGWPLIDDEGRYVEFQYPGLSVISLYLPSGSSSEQRQALKMDLLERLVPVLEGMRRKRREYVICGDFNIAHKNIDIKNWRSNQKNSGFLPEEREWLDHLFGPLGYVDAFRVVNTEPDQYTWWSNRGQARAKNVGWRIDYQVVSPGLAKQVSGASIYTRKRFSDHAPLTIDYDFEAP